MYKHIHEALLSALQNKCILLKPDAGLFYISRPLTILYMKLLQGKEKLVIKHRKRPLELHID